MTINDDQTQTTEAQTKSAIRAVRIWSHVLLFTAAVPWALALMAVWVSWYRVDLVLSSVALGVLWWIVLLALGRDIQSLEDAGVNWRARWYEK